MDKYYIRNEGYLGNALIWWQIGGGYTCDIKKAQKFTKEEAIKICERPEDSAYKATYIDELFSAQKLIIDCQYVDPKERLFENQFSLNK